MSSVLNPYDHTLGLPALDHVVVKLDPSPKATRRTRELANFEVHIDWTPQRGPPSRDFATAYAQRRFGLAPIVHGAARGGRGWLMAPEEIVHNDLLREQAEAGDVATWSRPIVPERAREARGRTMKSA